MIRFYRFKYSTNCDRVAMALAFKEIRTESVDIDPKDRSLVRKVSGQDLVPVIEDDGKVVADSMTIVKYLEDRFPGKPLYPKETARRTEMLLFIDWFNRVWKRPPNDMEAEMGKPSPDQEKIAKWGRNMTDALDLFEGMLSGREFLMGDGFSAADVAAWPFLRYAASIPEDDQYLFHKILVEYQPLGDSHPRLRGWIERLSRYPMA